jgi:hypothetical protein
MLDFPWDGNEEADYLEPWDFGPALGWDASTSAPGWDDPGEAPWGEDELRYGRV